jgi:hypothetical protein
MVGWTTGTRRWVTTLQVAVVCLAFARPAAAAAGDRHAEMDARRAYAAGNYQQALDLYAKLYAETLHPVYLRNIGRCHQAMREPQKAINAFRDYLTKSKGLAAEERTEIEGYIKEMEALRDEQERQQHPAPVPAATPPPPAPVPAAPAPAPTPTQAPLTLSAPGSAPAPASSPFYTRWWFWTAVGVVVVGGAVAAVVLTSGGGPTRPTCLPEITGGCK